MKRVTIGLGIEYDAEHVVIPSDVSNSFRYSLIKRATDLFGGVTVRNTTGGWKNSENGQHFYERGWSIEILIGDNEPGQLLVARQFAHEVKNAMQQAAIVFIIEDVQAEFI